MTDKELLELAAKAAGIEGIYIEKVYDWDSQHKGEAALQIGDCSAFTWNPLTDDGDALRLAVKLGMMMYIWQPNDGLGVHNTEINRMFMERHNKDPYAATRRAIVRAAAEIGKAMP